MPFEPPPAETVRPEASLCLSSALALIIPVAGERMDTVEFRGFRVFEQDDTVTA